jgi:hypothetical protein
MSSTRFGAATSLTVSCTTPGDRSTSAPAGETTRQGGLRRCSCGTSGPGRRRWGRARIYVQARQLRRFHDTNSDDRRVASVSGPYLAARRSEERESRVRPSRRCRRRPSRTAAAKARSVTAMMPGSRWIRFGFPRRSMVWVSGSAVSAGSQRGSPDEAHRPLASARRSAAKRFSTGDCRRHPAG